MSRIFLAKLPVTQDLIDANQHVNNLAYLRWMQDIATAHSAAQGWPFERYVAIDSGWFVRSHFIEYLHPALSGDTLLAYTWVHAISKYSSSRRYCFVRQADKKIMAKAETRWVFVHFTTGKLTRIPQEVAEAFPTVPEDDPALLAVTGKERFFPG